MDPDLVQAILQVGGVPALIILAMYKLWNGTGKKVDRIDSNVQKIDSRLVKLETRFEERFK